MAITFGKSCSRHTGILAFVLGRCARFRYSTEISGRRRCRRSSALLRKTPLRALTKTARCSALQTRAQRRIQNGDPARTRESTAALLIVRCTPASLSADAHGCQTCGAKSAPGDVTSQAPLSCRRVCRTRRTTGKRRACPSSCSARSSATAMHRCQRLNCTLLSSLLLTGGSGYFHGHHGQPPKLSRAVPDESLAIFDATPRPVRFPCPPSSREKRGPDLARALWRSAQSQYLNPVFVFDLRYSTMMILNHIHNKPSYCIDTCQRGRVEDGSFMVSCNHHHVRG